MGLGIKNHGKKTDQCTQSPMLKIFKDIMQRENTDPEKANLLKVKRTENKKRKYSGSKSKSEKTNASKKTGDTTGSERPRRSDKYNVYSEKNDHSRTHSIPFRQGKKESWWLWADTDRSKDETCSCVSCALKRIASSEKFGYLCLALLFLVAMAVVFFYIVPLLSCEKNNQEVPSLQTGDFSSDVFTKKIDLLTGRQREEASRMKNKKPWDGISHYNGLSAYSGIGNDFEDNSFKGAMERTDSLDGPITAELSNALGTNKVNIEGSDRLKNFYRKLVQTDAKIKNMKNGFYDLTPLNTIQYENQFKSEPDRSKRSLKSLNRAKHSYHKRNSYEDSQKLSTKTPATEQSNLNKFNLYYPPFLGVDRNKQSRNKRMHNESQPTGFVIEKKKLILEYEPNKKKFPKCSHAPKESKSHEKQLKHPFYKNTQRLDELLDNFMNKNINDILVNPLALNPLLDDDVKTLHPCKHKHPQLEDVKQEKTKSKKTNDQRPTIKDSDMHFDKYDDLNRFENELTLPPYLILSTFPAETGETNPTTKYLQNKIERPPGVRKLLQVYDRDEHINAMEESEKKLNDRYKRTEMSQTEDPNPYIRKYTIPTLVNKNWKGPMPLYPDELNFMIEQAAIGAANKISMPVNTKDVAAELDDMENNLSDMQYVEDYTQNKYDKLVKMAQAYSDYGVLDGKKEPTTVKDVDDKSKDHRVKLSMDRHKVTNALPPESEGIRIEVKPNANSEDTGLGLISQFFHKHVKLATTTPKYMSTDYLAPLDLHLGGVKRFDVNPLHKGLKENAESNNKFKKSFNETFSDEPDPLKLFIKNKSTVELEKQIQSDEKYRNYKEPYDNKIFFSIGTNKRSLKSVKEDVSDFEFIDDKQYPLKFSDTNNTNETTDRGLNMTKRNHTNYIETDCKEAKTNISSYDPIILNKSKLENTDVTRNNKEMSPLDFILMMSNFFHSLANFATSNNNTGYNAPDANLLRLNSKTNDSETMFKIENMTSDIVYPIYDADMIENIGHRSRVLMSVDSKYGNLTEDIYEKNEKNVHVETEKNIKTSDKNKLTQNLTISKHNITSNPSNSTADINDVPSNESKTSLGKNNNETKVVKRSASDERNMIFWNDIYDDEYGVKYDPFIDDRRRNKHDAKQKDFIKKSNTWFRDKMKIIGDSFKGSKNNVEQKTRTGRAVDGYGIHGFNSELDGESTYTNIESENVKDMDNNEESDDPKTSTFAHMRSVMKKTCQQAAQAVQKTKSLELREDHKQDEMATSLMQQLVRLMTDVVDFQVQQRTCLQLPSDLRDFLEWLTSPSKEESSPGGKLSIKLHGDPIVVETEYELKKDSPADRLVDAVPTATSESEEMQDSRSDCLGTISAVQDLMQQYEEMSDEDKNKMVGVKEYLENQLEFLHKQLASYNEYNFQNLLTRTEYPLRFRRAFQSSNERHNHHTKFNRFPGRRFKRKLHKFIRNFNRKHTKSTASNFEGVHDATEPNRNNKAFERNENALIKDGRTQIANGGKDGSGGNQKTMRNLQDIYYRALEEAKKYTSVKHD